jgi:cathepsin B
VKTLNPFWQGCGGGWPEYAFNYMMTKGLPSDTCYPYTSGQGDSGTCLSACKDGSAKMLTTHKIKSWDYVNGEAAMMAALVNGPIAVAFAVYEDFFSYKTGVYVAPFPRRTFITCRSGMCPTRPAVSPVTTP